MPIDTEGWTPLQSAAVQGHHEIVQSLSEQPNVDANHAKINMVGLLFTRQLPRLVGLRSRRQLAWATSWSCDASASIPRSYDAAALATELRCRAVAEGRGIDDPGAQLQRLEIAA